MALKMRHVLKMKKKQFDFMIVTSANELQVTVAWLAANWHPCIPSSFGWNRKRWSLLLHMTGRWGATCKTQR